MCSIYCLTTCTETAPRSKQTRTKLDNGHPPKRPIARPPEPDEDETDKRARLPTATRAPSSSKLKSTKVISKPDANEDAPVATASKSKAKGKVAVAPGEDDEEVQPPALSSHPPEHPVVVPAKSKRKLPAPPKAFIESDSEDNDDGQPPPPRKASKPSRTQTDETSRTSNRGDVDGVLRAREEGMSASSARTERTGASGKRGQGKQTAIAPPSELDGKAVSLADDEDPEIPKAEKAPRKRVTKTAEDTRNETVEEPRKRSGGKRAAVLPAEDLEERLQEPDEAPAPPRKRAKRAVVPNVDTPAEVPDVVAEDVEQPGDPFEEPPPKPRSKPASRSKKAPTSRDKTQTVRYVAVDVAEFCPILLGRSCCSMLYRTENRGH